ncbi:MAG TPA: hypothetical protein DCE42_01865 [Myxococcales bacterium]|nr:hypothetical protein [Deltaproteobacteria bacterium]MBU52895.1 hypothetical protein [Deltaproteobacteria bacterium]HAA53470.1 hypothetical protein [Myxococcales bacterium]
MSTHIAPCRGRDIDVSTSAKWTPREVTSYKHDVTFPRMVECYVQRQCLVFFRESATRAIGVRYLTTEEHGQMKR